MGSSSLTFEKFSSVGLIVEGWQSIYQEKRSGYDSYGFGLQTADGVTGNNSVYQTSMDFCIYIVSLWLRITFGHFFFIRIKGLFLKTIEILKSSFHVNWKEIQTFSNAPCGIL